MITQYLLKILPPNGLPKGTHLTEATVDRLVRSTSGFDAPLLGPAGAFSEPLGNTGPTAFVGGLGWHSTVHYWDLPLPGVVQADVMARDHDKAVAATSATSNLWSCLPFGSVKVERGAGWINISNLDYRASIDTSNGYGPGPHDHLLVSGTACLLPRPTPATVQRILCDVTKAIGMTVLIPPQCCESESIISGIIGITTSHVSLHIEVGTTLTFHLDVFSCKPFDPTAPTMVLRRHVAIISFAEMIVRRHPGWHVSDVRTVSHNGDHHDYCNQRFGR